MPRCTEAAIRDVPCAAGSGYLTLWAGEGGVTVPVTVFISYRRDDTKHAAGRLGERLGERFDLFMDIDDIRPGTDFTQVVHAAVERADVVLALIGPAWLGQTGESGVRRLDDPHDWVALEIGSALTRGTPVIPVLVDDARMPSAAELPMQLAGLANLQAVTVSHESFSADCERLSTAIESMVAGEVRREAAPAVPPRTTTQPAPDHGTRGPALPHATLWLVNLCLLPGWLLLVFGLLDAAEADGYKNAALFGWAYGCVVAAPIAVYFLMRLRKRQTWAATWNATLITPAGSVVALAASALLEHAVTQEARGLVIVIPVATMLCVYVLAMLRRRSLS
jgi:hypothetical protein